MKYEFHTDTPTAKASGVLSTNTLLNSTLSFHTKRVSTETLA